MNLSINAYNNHLTKHCSGQATECGVMAGRFHRLASQSSGIGDRQKMADLQSSKYG